MAHITSTLRHPPPIYPALSELNGAPAGRWMQDASRTGRLLDLIFAADREAMYDVVLCNSHLKEGIHVFTYEFATAPGPEQPFCDPQLDNETKLRALCLDQCTRAVMLGTPLLAYLRKDCNFRISEYNIHIKPKVWIKSQNTGQLNGEPWHSVLLLSSSFIPSTASSTHPFADPGIILDPSAPQMGYKETISCAFEYSHSKFDFEEGDSSKRLGFHLGRFKAEFASSYQSFNRKNHDLRLEASLRMICNILFSELEHVGGTRAVMDLNAQEWDGFVHKLRWRLREGLKKLRSELDNIRFVSILSSDDTRKQEDQLLGLYNGEGYKEMMALVSDIAP